MTDQLAAGYEGTEPFPDVGDPPRTVAGAVRVMVTLAIVIVPFAELGVAVWLEIAGPKLSRPPIDRLRGTDRRD